jgi:pyridoxal phosphate enzyme (YggS family)
MSAQLRSAPGVASRLREQLERVHAAALAAGREPSTVRLLAVSKFHPASAIAEAYAAGQRDFGENYVQELVRKSAELAHLPDLRFHLIGHLQTNKAKAVAEVAHSVQTVDSVRLCQELGKRRSAVRPDAPLDVLVEVNVAGEASKSGCAADDLPELLDAVEAEPALRLRGLLTIPPSTPEPALARPYFERLGQLRNACGGRARLPELSMGMSADLEVAVACGSTWVRIGTAIFGERPGPLP